MSAPSVSMEKARALVAWLWDELAAIVRFARRWWPCNCSLLFTAIAQFELEVKRARRASGEKGEGA